MRASAPSPAGDSAEPRLYSVSKVALLLSVTERYVWILIERGELKSLKIGTRRLIPDSDLREFLAKLRADEEQARAAAGADTAA